MATPIFRGATLQETGAGAFRMPAFVQKASPLYIFLAALGLFFSCSGPSEATLYRAGDKHIPTQRFDIDLAEGAVIAGANGTILAIPADAFTDEFGNSLSGKIEIRLKEANTSRAILTGGLITQTGDRLLATDGMYLIEAFQDGKSLKLKADAGLQAWFPTQNKDPRMGLYAGAYDQDKMDWVLLETPEGEPGYCDKDEANRKKCKKCKGLLRMAKNIKTGPKPKKSDYWAKRHYWENGVLYFASSGSRKPILSQDLLDDCKDYLEQSKRGRDLLATVEQIKQDQVDKAGDYYSYRLQNLGWYNMDRLLKQDLITFKGKVVDEEGNRIPEAQVHLFCKEEGLRVHTMTAAKDGSFEFQFVPGQSFSLYAYKGSRIGQSQLQLEPFQSEVDALPIAKLEKGDLDAFLKELL